MNWSSQKNDLSSIVGRNICPGSSGYQLPVAPMASSLWPQHFPPKHCHHLTLTLALSLARERGKYTTRYLTDAKGGKDIFVYFTGSFPPLRRLSIRCPQEFETCDGEIRKGLWR